MLNANETTGLLNKSSRDLNRAKTAYQNRNPEQSRKAHTVKKVEVNIFSRIIY